MKLFELGSLQWTVLAVCDHRGSCPVLDELKRLGTSNPSAMRILRDLRQGIPERGPDYRNKEKVKKLKGCGDIYELREQPTRGPKPRVLFFKDDDNTVICTSAFAKREDIPKDLIRKAEKIKAQYFYDKQSGNNQIIRLPVSNDNEN